MEQRLHSRLNPVNMYFGNCLTYSYIHTIKYTHTKDFGSINHRLKQGPDVIIHVKTSQRCIRLAF